MAPSERSRRLLSRPACRRRCRKPSRGKARASSSPMSAGAPHLSPTAPPMLVRPGAAHRRRGLCHPGRRIDRARGRCDCRPAPIACRRRSGGVSASASRYRSRCALLPGAVVMALFFMAIPGFIAGLILWKVSELRHAATWPSTRAQITRSEMRAEHHRHSGEVTQVRNLPDVEYEFTLGDQVIKGNAHRRRRDSRRSVEATLDHYRVGTTVPVYYDPEEPRERAARTRCAVADRRALRHRCGACSWSASRCWRSSGTSRASSTASLGLFPREGVPARRRFLHPGRHAWCWPCSGRRGARWPRRRPGRRLPAASSPARSSTIASGSVARAPAR